MSNQEMNYKIGDLVEFSFTDEDGTFCHGQGVLTAKLSNIDKPFGVDTSTIIYSEDSESEGWVTMGLGEEDIIKKITE